MRSGVQFSNAAGGSNLKCRFHHSNTNFFFYFTEHLSRNAHLAVRTIFFRFISRRQGKQEGSTRVHLAYTVGKTARNHIRDHTLRHRVATIDREVPSACRPRLLVDHVIV